MFLVTQNVTSMNLPKVIIKESYADYLSGKEVEATVVSDKNKNKNRVEKGMHVMGFHSSIDALPAFTAPREKRYHYIGVEGMVTEIYEAASDDHTPEVKVVKV